MSGTTDMIMCPACGSDFQPQEGVSRCFCPNCGRPVDIAQARSLTELIRSAQETARLSQQIARQAQQTLSEAEHNLAHLKATQPEAGTDGSEVVAFAPETAVQEPAQARPAQPVEAPTPPVPPVSPVAPKQPKAYVPPRTAVPTVTPVQPRTSGRSTASGHGRRPFSYVRDACVRDQQSGQALFLVTLPDTWTLDESHLRRFDSYSQPFRPFASFQDGGGCMINLSMGDGGMQMSEGMRATVNMYGGQFAGQDRTNYADMPDPTRLADARMRDILERVASGGFSLLSSWASPDLAARQREAKDLFSESARRSFGTAPLKDPFAAELVRVYGFTYGGAQRKIAVYVRMLAVKDASGVDLMPVGLAANLGSAVGGLFRRKRGRGVESSGNASRRATGCAPDFDTYVGSGTIYWNVRGIATLTAPPELFDESLEQAFMPFVRSFRIHPDMAELIYEAQRLYEAGVQNATVDAMRRMNAQTQAALAADRQRQAAFDARNAAWQAASDAHHDAFRARTNAEFSQAGASSPDFSEAIRSVNTYVTSDGREVELDVSAEHAWENQAGDVIGTSGSFEPSTDWTEIPRR